MSDTKSLRALAEWLATSAAPIDASEPESREWDEQWDRFLAVVTPTWVLEVLDVVEAAAEVRRTWCVPLSGEALSPAAVTERNEALDALRDALDRLGPPMPTDTTPTPEGVRERVAKALHDCERPVRAWLPWATVGPTVQEMFLKKADAALAAAGLPELREERDRLLSEVREWMCAKCRYVYPGPPRPGVMCVVCPRCDGVATIPRSSLMVQEAERRVAELEAERERLTEQGEWVEKLLAERKELRATNKRLKLWVANDAKAKDDLAGAVGRLSRQVQNYEEALTTLDQTAANLHHSSVQRIARAVLASTSVEAEQ